MVWVISSHGLLVGLFMVFCSCVFYLLLIVCLICVDLYLVVCFAWLFAWRFAGLLGCLLIGLICCCGLGFVYFLIVDLIVDLYTFL